MDDLINDMDTADVTLVCGDEVKIRAHKLVLKACSLVFKNILGNNSNPNRGNNGNNVIGKFGGMDKNFGSGPVGSKLDQKGIIQDGRNIKGQKKNMNKDFLPSQVCGSLSDVGSRR